MGAFVISDSPVWDLLLCVVMLASACGCGRVVLLLTSMKRFGSRLEYNVLSIAQGVISFGVAALILGSLRFLLQILPSKKEDFVVRVLKSV